MIKVLDGVRVVEMGTFITGPAAAMFLADMGADVVKVERPETGDPFRAFKGGLYSPHFQTYNRNKRSLALDTGDAADLEVFDALIADADIFIQNFRPGVADKLNVGADRLQKLNPRLIYCGISGFGPDGPGAEPPAHESGGAAGERLVAAADQSRQSARGGPGDRRFDDRHVHGVRRARRALRASAYRARAAHRRVDARGDVPLQPRRLYPLLPGGRGDGPVQPPQRLAVLCLRMRGRQMGGAAHVVAAAIL